MTNIAIEHDPVEIVDFPIENGGSFHSFLMFFVCLSEGITNHGFFSHFLRPLVSMTHMANIQNGVNAAQNSSTRCIMSIHII